MARCPRNRCAAWPISRAPMTGATAISPRARTSSTTGRRWSIFPTCLISWRGQMHAIQTSGNTIRNTTTDHFAGAAADEIADPRPWCELIRQWSTTHPEFTWLPRKFKIAVTGSPERPRRHRRARYRPASGEERRRRDRVRSPCGRRSGPHADVAKIIRDFLPQPNCWPI
jgi:hypothetical protein